jgi:hypothetical protein
MNDQKNLEGNVTKYKNPNASIDAINTTFRNT